MSYMQTRMHFDYESAQSVADLGSWRWRATKSAGFTTVYVKSRGLWILPNANRAWRPAAFSQERGASAKRTQAELRKSYISSSSQEPGTSGKLAAMFSLGNEELENELKRSVSSTLTLQIWEGPFLKPIKISCYVRHDVNFSSRCIKWELSIFVSVSVSSKFMLKDWNYRTQNTDILNLYVN